MKKKIPTFKTDAEAELFTAAADLTQYGLSRAKLIRVALAPRATGARYNRRQRRIIVELTNGCTFAFPPHLAQGLETATDDQLAAVEILGRGYGLHWEALDADLSIPGLLAGRFGSKAHMGRIAGRLKPAKQARA